MGSLCIFANTPKNTYLKANNKLQKCIKIILMTVLKMKWSSRKMKDNSFLSSLELSADASDEIVKGLGIPKSVVNASKIKMSYGHDPKKRNQWLILNQQSQTLH